MLAKKLGRPTDFDSERATKIIELYIQGATEDEVAEIMGVHVNTLLNWKKANRTFLWATTEAKLWADSMVEASLFKRAVGMRYTEEQVTKNGTSTVEKYALPDVQAQQFWLRNRQPDKWRDKREEEHKTLILKKELIGQLTQEDLIKFMETELQKLKVIEEQSP